MRVRPPSRRSVRCPHAHNDVELRVLLLLAQGHISRSMHHNRSACCPCVPMLLVCNCATYFLSYLIFLVLYSADYTPPSWPALSFCGRGNLTYSTVGSRSCITAALALPCPSYPFSCTCTCTCTCTCICTCTCTPVPAHLYLHLYLHTCTCTPVPVHLYLHLRLPSVVVLMPP